MESLARLKKLIDEDNFPYYEDSYLQSRLMTLEDEGQTYTSLVRELLLNKSSIEEIKLGDIVIPSPKNHFLMLASKYRGSKTGSVVRADDR